MSEELKTDVLEAINNGVDEVEIKSSFGITDEQLAEIKGEMPDSEADVEATPEGATNENTTNDEAPVSNGGDQSDGEGEEVE